MPFVISEKDKNFYSEYHEDYNQDDFKSFETETSDLVKNLEEKSKTEKLHDCLISVIDGKLKEINYNLTNNKKFI